MVDFNIEEKVQKHGLKFGDIFRSLFLYSVSLFLAFWWKSYFDEVIFSVFPSGKNLYEKSLIGFFMTFVFVFIAWMLMRDGRKEKSEMRRR
jgi:glycerol uptake facilitator-like aquaporin